MLSESLAEAVALLRRRVGAAWASEGEAWFDGLPTLIGGLIHQWGLTTTNEPARAGFSGIALPVQRSDQSPAVLKVSLSIEPRDDQNEVLSAWNGRHAARLLERDDDQHARLLERLSSRALIHVRDPVEAMSVAGNLAAQLAVTPPPTLPRMADVALEIAAGLEQTATHHRGTLTQRDIDIATATYRELGRDQPALLLHGDLQGSNILWRPGDGWAVIDPLGMVGEVALEALTPLRDRWAFLPTSASPRNALLSQLYAFADAAQASRDRVVAWTRARAVRAVIAEVNDDQGLHDWVATQLRPAP